MKEPLIDPTIRQLLNTSQQAAESLTQEMGFWSCLGRWLEETRRLRQIKARERMERKALNRCRKGKHDFQNWEAKTPIKVYENKQGPNDLPKYFRYTWVGHCKHCGKPDILIRDAK